MSQTTSPAADSKNQTLAQIALAVVAIGFIAFRFPEFARTALVFVITLSILVFVHEWGHFQFARWSGMKVNRFAIGFPPFIYTKNVKGVDYSIGALPIGGMVDIAGLGSEEEMVGTAKGDIAAPTRDTSRPYGQKQFQDGSLFARFMVLFAGPLMNFLFAVIAFIVVFSTVGLPKPIYQPRVLETRPNMPAAKAGIKAGDSFISISGKKTSTPEEVITAIHGSVDKSVRVVVERDKQQVPLTLTPVMNDLDNDGKKEPAIGVSFDQSAISSFTYKKVSPAKAVESGFISSMAISLSILDVIKRAVSRNLSSEEVKGIGGPVRIAQTAGQASQFGWPIALNFAAMLSVNLGLMNLLPFPALDGGRIMFLGYELVMRRPVDPRKEGIVHAAGMVLLLAFMLFITLRDVVSL